MNRAIDDPENSTAVTNIIENVLLQEPDIAEAFTELKETLTAIKKQVRVDISHYCEMVSALQKIENIIKEYERLRIKVEQTERLQQLSTAISTEREKLQLAKQREKERTDLIEKIQFLRKEIIRSQKKFLNSYEKYCSIIDRAGNQINTSLVFSALPVWKQRSFQTELSNVFDNRNYPSFKIQHNYDLISLGPNDYCEEMLNKLWDAMSNPHAYGALTIKTAYDMESALIKIFGDWYNIHYIVKSGEDTIEEMSPGKKALVLLELLISLENSKCPILIDQPEDDLDNRSIYEDLVQYIKEKKHERQIIIVTHNANIVLGADAEEVIIANQSAKGAENVSRSFEYRSGAIENDEIGKDEEGNPLPGILNKQGIQTQICDILEGGRLAFELRQNKYMKHSR